MKKVIQSTKANHPGRFDMLESDYVSNVAFNSLET